MHLPTLIQGGPDAALSTWSLARAVAEAGQLGTVSSAPLAVVLARRLQEGDFDGPVRRALEQFPFPGLARRVWEQFYVPGGREADQPFELVRQPTLEGGPALIELTVLANFVEVFLAREGHRGCVGLHVDGQASIALLPSLYGAMLAGVDYVLASGRWLGTLPGLLERLTRGSPAALEVRVASPEGEAMIPCGFDPHQIAGAHPPALGRPRLIVFVPSAEEAAGLILRANGQVDGFLWERTGLVEGWPDTVGLERFRSLGVPFWVGGLRADPGTLASALEWGAAGLRLTLPFTFCEESALDSALKQRVLSQVRHHPATVDWTRIPSPTGFDLSVLTLAGTAAAPEVLAARPRLCDVGYFREPYRKPDGTVGYRCPGEPVTHYAGKGGEPARGEAQVCLCNALLAGIGLGQVRGPAECERALVPAGGDLAQLPRFLRPGRETFTAAEVIATLLG